MIADMGKSGNRAAQALLIPAIVLAVGIAAFGLGRLSALQGAHTGLVIHQASPALGSAQ